MGDSTCPPAPAGGHAAAARHALQAAQNLIDSAQQLVEFALGELHRDDVASVNSYMRSLERTSDTRQPGGVPGPEAGDVPEGALHLVHPIDEVLDSTPTPEYRAPLPGTLPEYPREWRCASCAMVAGPIARRTGHCPCGGEIAMVGLDDIEPPLDPCMHESWVWAGGVRHCTECSTQLDPTPAG